VSFLPLHLQMQVAHLTNRPLYKKTHTIQIFSCPSHLLLRRLKTPRDRPAQLPPSRGESRCRPSSRLRLRRPRRAAPACSAFYSTAVRRHHRRTPTGGRSRRHCCRRREGRGRRSLARQGACDVLRGDRGGRARGAAHVGAHRRALGPARHRRWDQAPHEASGTGGPPFCFPVAHSVCVRVVPVLRVLFSLLY
jgi:hypothetical protein